MTGIGTYLTAIGHKVEDDGLDEAVAALRTFALIDRETVSDEREPTIITDCIRLHRLVRQVAAARCEGEIREGTQRVLAEALVGSLSICARGFSVFPAYKKGRPQSPFSTTDVMVFSCSTWRV
jgi:hypothetical protein